MRIDFDGRAGNVARPVMIEREVRLGRASAPACARLHRLKRWRWDVRDPVPYGHGATLAAGEPSGYSFTRAGALRAIGRHLR